MELLGWYLQCVCLRAGAVPSLPPLEIKILHGNRARNKYFQIAQPQSCSCIAVYGGAMVRQKLVDVSSEPGKNEYFSR